MSGAIDLGVGLNSEAHWGFLPTGLAGKCEFQVKGETLPQSNKAESDARE